MTKRLILGVCLAVVVGVGCFFAAYQLWPDGGSTEVQPDIVMEWERARQEEEANPRFEGVVNGIRLYSTDAEAAVQRKSACTDAKPEEVEHVTMSAVAGTPMEIIPTYLPLDAEEQPPMWPPVICRGGSGLRRSGVDRPWQGGFLYHPLPRGAGYRH